MQKFSDMAAEEIDFSIIVGPPNSAAASALAELDYPKSRFEVTVVDDCSRELVARVVQAFGSITSTVAEPIAFTRPALPV